MEIQFFHERFTEKDPELLVDHIGRMASGEAPFIPATLSLVYDKLVESAFPKHIPSVLDPGSPIPRAPASTSTVASPSTPSSPHLPQLVLLRLPVASSRSNSRGSLEHYHQMGQTDVHPNRMSTYYVGPPPSWRSALPSMPRNRL
jgi:hypothetical protein